MTDRLECPNRSSSPVPYRRHGKAGCSANHRTWQTKAKCIWNRATWISGSGPYATVSRCRPGVTTVMLHPTAAQARAALAAIAGGGCGGVCRGRHDFVVIAMGAVA